MDSKESDDMNADLQQAQADQFAAQIEALLRSDLFAPEPIPVPDVSPASDEDVDTFFGDLH